ncbi:MAG: four helix bundle protein [Verrucomicrobiota bacterium]|jgi:four helix bundle protein
MNPEEFKQRTKGLALQIVRLCEALPKGVAASVLGRQLLRSGTSVGANYRAACRAKSRADFIAKLAIVEEECDETLYWLELLVESGLVKQALVAELADEGAEILALVVASINTARRGAQSAIRNPQSAIV